MRIILNITMFIAIITAAFCNNPSSNNNDSSASYIENNKYINTDIKFSVTFPPSWLLTMDTTVGSTKYNLFARKPATDSVIFTIKILKNVKETNIDSIMNTEEKVLKNSLESYVTTGKSGCGIPHTVSGCFGYLYSAVGKAYNCSKIFSIKGTNEVIFHTVFIAEPMFANVMIGTEIVGSIIFE